jgi:hypothetical protein
LPRPHGGRAGLDTLANSLSLAINDLFPIAEALHISKFAEIKDGALKLTAAGNVLAHGNTDTRTKLLRERLLRFLPITAHICRVRHEHKGHRAPRMRFEAELEDHLTRRDAERTAGRHRVGALRGVLCIRRRIAFVFRDRQHSITTQKYEIVRLFYSGGPAVLNGFDPDQHEQVGTAFNEIRVTGCDTQVS